MVEMNSAAMIPNDKTSGRLFLRCDGIAGARAFSLCKYLVLTPVMARSLTCFCCWCTHKISGCCKVKFFFSEVITGSKWIQIQMCKTTNTCFFFPHNTWCRFWGWILYTVYIQASLVFPFWLERHVITNHCIYQTAKQILRNTMHIKSDSPGFQVSFCTDWFIM